MNDVANRDNLSLREKEDNMQEKKELRLTETVKGSG